MAAPKSKRPQKKSRLKPEGHWIDQEPGLILLDSSLKPLAFNYQAAKILFDPSQPSAEQKNTFKVPEDILKDIRNRAAKGLSSEATLYRSGRRNYICRVTEMESCIEGSPQPLLLVLQRQSSIEEAVYEAAAQFHLTEREREVLEGISKGLSGKELASCMKISPNTVKAYMHLIMVKMGVATRVAIIAKIFEHTHSNGGEAALVDAHAAGRHS
jgi:DNA-binding CsgD family transcriptional regulator